jgi:hypothetical protein
VITSSTSSHGSRHLNGCLASLVITLKKKKVACVSLKKMLGVLPGLLRVGANFQVCLHRKVNDHPLKGKRLNNRIFGHLKKNSSYLIFFFKDENLISPKAAIYIQINMDEKADIH